MESRVRNFFRSFDGLLSCIFLCILTLLLFIEVVSRYVFHHSSALNSEIAGQCFIWFIYLSISYVTGQKNHIVVDIAPMIFPKSWLKVIDVISNIIFLAFSAIMTVYGTMLVMSTMEYQFTLTISGISMGVVYSIIPFAFGIMTVRLLLFTYDSIRTVLNPSSREGEDHA
ncbi:TRAP transporter small permease [uncultured Desulfovibrio sp.]|jgi:C4-dicarboxylate transporter DctQ subunit|uniref:TRAP transporter small permease n=1 Tax=uncultured Desulfovibrio sp. TaxID=167968 RepID=UPI00265D4760|nr:TRAP transporter small permease [uncultured Desulfovibrio sp.]